jgi:hypothetical protein
MMSCYQIAQDHARYILDVAEELAPTLIQPEDKDRQELGQMLLDECQRSVAYRYRQTYEEAAVWEDERYDENYDISSGGHGAFVVEISQAYKAIDCYVYQACEHPDWLESEACKWISTLKDRLSRHVPGYDAAEWGYPGSDRD